MMKVRLIILGLLLSVLGYGQMVGVMGSSAEESTPSADTTTEYKAILTAMTTDPTGDTITWQDSLIIKAKAHGWWDKGNVMYLAAQVNEDGAKINWCNPGTHDITDPGSTAPTFTRNEGWEGDGSSDYLSLNYNPVDDGSSNMATDSICVAVYCRSDISVETGAVIGGSDGTNQTHILPYYSASEFLFIRLNTTSAYQHDHLAISYGMFTGVRNHADTIRGYTNGALDNARAVSSSGEVDATMFLLANNNNGTANFFSTNQVSFAWVGEWLTPAEVAYQNDDVEWYMDKIGKGVQ